MVKRLVSIFMILMVLGGSLGLNYNAHFCGGKLIKSEYSIYPSEKLSCGMKHQKSDDGSTQFRKWCCENEHLHFQLDEDIVHANVFCDFDLAHDFIIPSPVYENVNGDLKLEYDFIGYSPPPALEQEIYLVNQSFLI